MKFAVLTQKDESFSLIQECFAADEILCERAENLSAWLHISARQEHVLLLIDARYFHACDELVACCKAHANGLNKIIVFGCCSDRISMARIFNAGVNDVLVGDIDCNEMYIRTQRLFKDAKKSQTDQCHHLSSSLMLGAYALCGKNKVLTYNGTPIVLNKREFAMAWLFFSAPGTFFSKQKLAHNIWDKPQDYNERTIERHINTLRKKLGITKNSAIRLRTIYSLGYKLEVSID